MAGAGYRTWSASEVVTAANVQTYLQDQVCMVFADTTARDAITPTEGMICYVKSTDQVQAYNGSAWTNVTSVITGDVFTEDSTNKRVGINESSPGASLHIEGNSSATDQMVRIYSRTGVEHDADLSFALDNGTGETFTIGIDDSDSDKFKISDGTALGTNDRMVIDSSGAMTVAGGITTNITGNASGSSGSCTGNAATATEATNVTASANNTTDETVYPTFVDGATGTQGIETDTGLTYNPSTGVLTSTAFTGNLTGNVTGNTSGSSGSCTGNAATATEATNVTASANNTTDETVYPTFVDGATGTQGIETDTGLTYNPSTGVLTSTAFTGNLTGNVTGNTSGSSGSCTGNAATATALATARTIGGTSFDGTAAIVPATITVADTTDTSCSVALFESATGDLAPKSDGGLTYNAGTGTLTATAFAGALTGNVTGNASGSAGSCTGNAATATEATNVTATANNTTDETVYPTFVDGATGTQGIETDTGLTYNPSTGVLTSTAFAGNLTGNVTGNASGTAATVTGAAQSAITSVGTLTGVTVSGTATIGVAVGQAVDLDRKTADYTLVLTDAGKVIEINRGSSENVTIPPNSSVAFPIGTQIVVVRLGSGAVVITEGSGVTTRSDEDKNKIKSQYSSCVLIKHETDEWYILGNLAA